MKIIAILAVVLLLASCASRPMRGDEARTTSEYQMPNLKVTALQNQSLSIDNYRFFELYFRNLNEDWLRIKNVEILSVDGSDKYRIILGADLKQWRKSIALDYDLQIESAKAREERDKLKKQKAESAQYSDEDHLYQLSSLPAGLQVQKWVLFQFDKPQAVKSFKFEITWINDLKQIVEVELSKRDKP